jgi:CheY-like chemotaxis protein
MSRACRESGKMLLCIDDSRGVLEYERSLFEKSGYLVVTATSGREGLRLVMAAKFDAVILDYQMPELSGHDLALEIRRIRPHTPVIMFSATEIPTETHTLVDAFVPKAGSMRELLLSTVFRLCERQETDSA